MRRKKSLNKLTDSVFVRPKNKKKLRKKVQRHFNTKLYAETEMELLVEMYASEMALSNVNVIRDKVAAGIDLTAAELEYLEKG